MLGIQLQRHHEVSLARQIYQALREQMTEGRLHPGEILPSTRELAKQLAVSRNTVCEAYDMLLAEGFIESRQGSSTRVAGGLQLGKKEKVVDKLDMISPVPANIRADFRTGRPDLRRFPTHTWLQLLRKNAEQMPLEQWGYTGPAGLPQLREEIAAWLFRSKGMVVSPQDIFITAGATQALHLLADLLFSEGQGMMVEDPCHMGMLKVLQSRRFKIHPVPVDEQGLQTDYLADHYDCGIYITPSHQYPLGGILSAARRVDLVRFVRKYDQYIIEDDYDSEFRYSGPPVSPLQALDPQRVIYVGTFSKILFPALRIGYVVLPERLQSRWRHLRTHADVQNPPFEQEALAEYLKTRKLDRHVQQMRKLYGQRRQILLETMTEVFGGIWRPWGDAAGLHLAVQFPGMSFTDDFARQAREHEIYITPVEYHSIRKGAHLDKLLLGYGHLEAKEIQAGIHLLKDLILV
ncbi:MAG: PLP-dependent aminotransferase family protein [Syntrophomonadaceae bacterium]|nr:PLP-dependent aminotransferase family protein [Syntrophomonadaceae bacterium]